MAWIHFFHKSETLSYVSRNVHNLLCGKCDRCQTERCNISSLCLLTNPINCFNWRTSGGPNDTDVSLNEWVSIVAYLISTAKHMNTQECNNILHKLCTINIIHLALMKKDITMSFLRNSNTISKIVFFNQILTFANFYQQQEKKPFW